MVVHHPLASVPVTCQAWTYAFPAAHLTPSNLSIVQFVSPQGIGNIRQGALLLPGAQFILQCQAFLLVPAVQAQLADAQNGSAQGQ